MVPEAEVRVDVVWVAPVDAARDGKAQKIAASIGRLRFCNAIWRYAAQKSFLNLDSGLTNS